MVQHELILIRIGGHDSQPVRDVYRPDQIETAVPLAKCVGGLECVPVQAVFFTGSGG